MIHQNQRQWVERNDAVPGYLYLIEAEGFHGHLEGIFIRRCKLGLSRNPQKRLEDLLSSQPPCNYKILRTIYVHNMQLGEEWLHDRFKHCNVKLLKSKEWFDLYPWQFLLVQRAFNHLEARSNFTPQIVFTRTVVGGLIAVVGIGALLFHQSESAPVKPIAKHTLINKNKYVSSRHPHF